MSYQNPCSEQHFGERPNVKREWHVDPTRRVGILSMQINVNGRVLACSSTVDDLSIGAPMFHIEHELRRKLMREVEDFLIGPR